MLKVTSFPIVTIVVFIKRFTFFSLIPVVYFVVLTEFVASVSKFAQEAVGAMTIHHELVAQLRFLLVLLETTFNGNVRVLVLSLG